ncbi:hypothetical protein GOBAR_DD27096 [Gossypium barbadense]|nr:hypothetical protein GOBAR_DD27096 [Gossypium barbadense]
MGENHHQAAATSSRLRIKHVGGEIVEVQGGHIVRSTGRKDRHSKVCTAKGPRDRRVRLSAHTAIQFYDVQDRLGYDRPSKAVDWLIKKAKSAIDELAELPPWNPLDATISTKKPNNQEDLNTSTATNNEFHIENLAAGSGSQCVQQHEMGDNLNNNSGFLPASLVSDEIADTMKSFFPLGASSETPPSSSLQFQDYPPDLLSRTSSHSQDLRLSLQSFPEPILLHHHEHHAAATAQAHHSESVLFSGTTPLAGFDGSNAGWEHHQQQQPVEIGRFQRFQFFSQRGPLQSSNTPLVRAWIDQPIDEHHHHHQIPQNIHQQAALSSMGFTTSGVYSGFRVPSRIQGQEEEHDSIANKLSSASSDSHH